MNKTGVICIFILIILSFSVCANNYTKIGGIGESYQTASNSLFNSAIGSDYDSFLVAITDPQFVPLVNDLDKDGKTEIIVLDGSTVKIFDRILVSPFLRANASITTANISGYGYMLTYDIDGDSLDEIIVASSTSNAIIIMNYSGGGFNIQDILSIPSANHTTGEIMINCKAANDCIAVYSKEIDVISMAGISAVSFTASAVNAEVTIHNYSGKTVGLTCLSKINHISVQDYDKDGTDEYIFASANYKSSSSDSILIEYVSVSGATITVEQTITITDSDWYDVLGATFDEAASNECCDDSCAGTYKAIGRTFTSPYVADIVSTGALETAIAFMKDPDEYRMRSYDSTGIKIGEYPENVLGGTVDADGIIVSNIFKASIFEENSNDFCVMGFDNSGNIQDPITGLDMVCASEDTTLFTTLFGLVNVHSDEFIDNTTQLPHNITEAYNNWDVITQSGFFSGGDAISEIATPYGIFDNNWGSVFGFKGGEIGLIFQVPQDEGALIPADVESSGAADLLYLTQNNLWYFDDRFVNSPGQISEIAINPCIDGSWKINTTVQITITVSDVDGDFVSADAAIYKGISGEQNETAGINTTAGTQFSFFFVANQTVGSGIIDMNGRDVFNWDTKDNLQRTFSVSTNGNEFGDCVTTITPDVIATGDSGDECTEDADCIGLLTCVDGVCEDENVIADTNAITLALRDIPTGGLGFTVIWLIVMAAVFIGFWLSRPDIIGLGAGLFVNILLLVIGVYLDFISFATLLVLIILGLIVVGLTWSRFLTGVNVGGNN